MDIKQGMCRLASPFITLIAAVMLASCTAPTTIESSWRNRNISAEPFHNLAVLALLDSESQSRQFERQATEALASIDIESRQGHEIIPAGWNLSQEDLEETLLNAGADGVLIFKLIAVDADLVYREPSDYVYESYESPVTATPYVNYYYTSPHYHNYLSSAYQVTKTQGYWQETNYYVLETALYDNETDELVWTIKSETKAPEDLEELAQSVMDEVIARLLQYNYIAVS